MRNKVIKGCELCDAPANLYCDSDQASLCWRCDNKVHGANFLGAKHSRCVLCHHCQAITPFTATGPKLPPSMSLCLSCCCSTTTRNQHNNSSTQNNNYAAAATQLSLQSRVNHGGNDDDYGDSSLNEEEGDFGSDYDEREDEFDDDDDDDNENENENQVVPLTISCDNGAISDQTEDQEEDHSSHVLSSLKRKRETSLALNL